MRSRIQRENQRMSMRVDLGLEFICEVQVLGCACECEYEESETVQRECRDRNRDRNRDREKERKREGGMCKALTGNKLRNDTACQRDLDTA